MSWTNLRKAVRSGKTLVTCRSSDDSGIPGTAVIRATIPEMPMPMGLIWWRHRDSKTIEILNCYVDEELRRVGIFRQMLRHLAEIASDFYESKIFTEEASQFGGEKALPACGFKELKNGTGWSISVSSILPRRSKDGS